MLSLLLSGFLILQPLAVLADQLALPSGDLTAPEVVHEVPTTPLQLGVANKITVKVTDNVGVKQVLLFYRTIGATEYNRVQMQKADADNYIVTLSPDHVNAPGIEYYIQAEDLAGNTLLHGYSFSPLIAKVQAASDSTVASDEGENGAVAAAVAASAASSGAGEPIWKNKWVWIGLGVVVAAAAAGGGGGDSPQQAVKPDQTTITITAPRP
jgi:hypothetical protein